jgi:hypothetical protein
VFIDLSAKMLAHRLQFTFLTIHVLKVLKAGGGHT